MTDVPKRFANYGTIGVSFIVSFLVDWDVQGELRPPPTENCFAYLAPSRFRLAWHFTDDNSRFVATRICELNV